MKFRRTFWLLSLVVTANVTAMAAPQQIDEEQNTVTEIRVKRTACQGVCPIDEVVLRADGSAEYTGTDYVEKIGVYRGRVWPYDFKKLAALLQEQRFFDLPNRYFDNIDSPTVITTVTRGSQTKTVSDNGQKGPLSLWGTGMAIQGVAAQIKWKKVSFEGKSGARVNAVFAYANGAKSSADVKANSRISPMQNAVFMVQTRGGAEVARIRTNRNGDFRVGLPPGNYIVSYGGKSPSARKLVRYPMLQPHWSFAVAANKWTQIKFIVTVPLAKP